MRYHAALWVVVAMPQFGAATSEAPYAGHCRLLRQMVEQSPEPDRALAVLQRLALGRTGAISEEVEKILRLPEGRLIEKEFAAPEVRACALGRIGELASDEAVRFLEKLSPTDVGSDAGPQLWTAVRVALQSALVRRIAGEQEKRLFLERILATPHSGTGGEWMWAYNLLCDRGEALSIGVIQNSIRKLWHGRRSEEEIGFCEMRIQVLSRDADRAKAIGSALRADQQPMNTRLMRWAIGQLAAMQTPNADRELQRFVAEAGRLTAGARTNPMAALKDEADRVLGERSSATPTSR